MQDITYYLDFAELKAASNGEWMNIAGDSLDGRRIVSVSTDSRADCSGALFISLKGENFDGHDYIGKAIASNASAVCVAREKYESLKKIIGKTPALIVDDTLKAYQDIAGYYRNKLKDITIIGITGSSGKTSTKDILNTILTGEFGENQVYATKGNTNNHVGVPQNILNLRPSHKYAIIEMGTNHYGEIDTIASIARPDIAVISSIGSAHLEFLKDLEGVAVEKASIFKYFPAGSKNIAIFPHETLKYKAIQETARTKLHRTFGTGDDCFLQYRYIKSFLEGSVFSMRIKGRDNPVEVSWPLSGEHQASNAAAAACAALELGIPLERIAIHLKNSAITGMRMKVSVEKGVKWINDAYNANPSSVKAGLKWISEITAGEDDKELKISRFIVILGDMLELGEKSLGCHKEVIGYALTNLKKCELFFVGPVMTSALQALDIGQNDIKSFPGTKEAAGFFPGYIRSGDIVYLKGSRGMKLELIKNGVVENKS